MHRTSQEKNDIDNKKKKKWRTGTSGSKQNDKKVRGTGEEGKQEEPDAHSGAGTPV